MSINIKDIPMSKVHENIYIGSRFDAANLEALKLAGVTHILNMTREVPNFHAEHFVYKQVSINDSPMIKILRHLEGAALFINEGSRTGKVLVHCACGISRSTSAVIAYFARYHLLEPDTALKRIKLKRSIVWPNFGFMHDLKQFYRIVLKNPQMIYEGKAKGLVQKPSLNLSDKNQNIRLSNSLEKKNGGGLMDLQIKLHVREKSWNRNGNQNKQKSMINFTSKTIIPATKIVNSVKGNTIKSAKIYHNK
jgi:protein-tyrosine phosphatase